MSQPITAGIPADCDLPDGYIVEWAAIDPTTGADVAGVKVSNVSLFGTKLGVGSTGNGTYTAGPYLLVGGPAA